LFPWLWLLDTAIAALFRVYLARLRGFTVVCDRFIYDSLVDLMLALRDDRLHRKLVGRLALRLVPKDAAVLLLDADSARLRHRKRDVAHDEHLAVRQDLYRLLAGHLRLSVLDTSGRRESVTAMMDLLQKRGPAEGEEISGEAEWA
jgi:hypothetical protein